MTNALAILLLGLILSLILADWLWLDLDLPLRAARMLDGLIEHVSFWR